MVKKNNKSRVINESIMNNDCMSIEEAEKLTLEKVRKIYEQNGKL